MKPKYWYCDRCDGCGWYEGGKYLQTTCEACKGHGIVLTDGLKPLTSEQVKEVKLILNETNNNNN